MIGTVKGTAVFWFAQGGQRLFSKKNLLVFLALVCFAPLASARSVGFQTALVADPGNPPIFVGLWYPAQAAARPVRIGLNTAQVAQDAAPDGRGLKLIVFSHGQGGGFADSIDTAMALARAGFVVAALTHTGDNFKDISRVLKIWDRTRQLHLMTNWVLHSWLGHDHLDPAHIGVFGFSAGGFTALVAAGGVPDLDRIPPYCDAHKAEFTCGLIARANPSGAKLPVPPGGWVHDPRIAAAVIAAPALGFTFSKAGLAGVHVPVQLWRADKDTTLPQPYYAQVVADDLPAPPDYHVVPDAEHLDFLAPCDAAKAAIAPQICESLPGFDRVRFHLQFDEAVTGFFAKWLGKRAD